MTRQVAITGVGAVGGYGCGATALQEALGASRLDATEVDRSAGYHLPESARGASLVETRLLAPWVSPIAARRMSAPSRFAVAAARMALEDAGLSVEELRAAAGAGIVDAGVNVDRDASDGPPSNLTGVFLASCFGPSRFSEGIVKAVLETGPQSVSPMLFAECVANAPAAQVAIACGATGSSIAITQREAGPLMALARGAAEIARGRIARALVGTVDEMPPLLHALLDRFGALAREDGAAGPPAGPFDRNRRGFIAAEGASVLVLEDLMAARARGARVYATVRCWGSAFDPTASRAGWGEGHAPLARSLERMLRRASLAPSQLDVIVSGASGSVAGDRLEGRILAELWQRSPVPPILAPKATTGEYGGGFLAGAVLAAAGSPFGPTRGFTEPDPELGIVPHDGAPLAPPRRLLATSLAAGGAAAWAVLESPA